MILKIHSNALFDCTLALSPFKGEGFRYDTSKKLRDSFTFKKG